MVYTLLKGTSPETGYAIVQAKDVDALRACSLMVLVS
jgi:hypothetical protein